VPVSEPTPEQKAQSPYVDPVAPYKVQESGSGKITEPLAETPKTITAISKEVIDDKAATSVRELARQTPGVTLGFAEGGNAFGDSLYIRGNGLAVRANVLFHDAHVAERDDNVEDQRWGGLLAATIKPTDAFKFKIDYYRLRTDGMPDFGVPFDPRTRLPVTETAGVPRHTWYGEARPGRDFMQNEAEIVTGTAEWKVTDSIKVTSKTRVGRTTVDYLASARRARTLPASPIQACGRPTCTTPTACRTPTSSSIRPT